MNQREPFHRSASVAGCPISVPESPKAVHAENDTQETPWRKGPCSPRFGVGTTLHRVPFQRSAMVATGVPPTAMHSEEDVQSTVFRMVPNVLEYGVGTMLHFFPFHRSASAP